MLYFQGFFMDDSTAAPCVARVIESEAGPYRLSVRTQDFQSWKPGATPGRVTKEFWYKDGVGYTHKYEYF